MPHDTAAPAPKNDPFDDGLDGVGPFLTSLNNYERLHDAEYSVPGAHDPNLSKNQKWNLNQKVRQNVNPEIESMMKEGTISPGKVLDTYQSKHDKNGDFGGEVALNGVYGDQYVVHGHYNQDGTTKPGSVGVKNKDDKFGLRIGHGVNDNLGGKPQDLFDHWST
jgi:hypothetical protein